MSTKKKKHDPIQVQHSSPLPGTTSHAASPRNEPLIFMLLLGVCCLAFYFNSLRNDFVWDDVLLIPGSKSVQSLENIPRFFYEPFWKIYAPEADAPQKVYYRPVIITSYALDWAIWGKNPFGFHLTNVILHLISGTLLFFLIKRVTRTVAPSMNESKQNLLATVSTGVFLLHPLQTNSVTFISGRTDIMAALFLFAALLCYLKAADGGANGDKHHFEARAFYLASLFCLALSLLSKEIGVLMPLLVLGWEYLRTLQGSETGSKLRKLSKRIGWVLPYFFVVAGYLFLRSSVLESAPVAPFQHSAAGLLAQFITVAKAIVGYFWLFLVPYNLHMERHIKFPEVFPEPWGALAALAVLALVAVVIILRRKLPLASFSLFWFFVTLAPSMNVVSMGANLNEVSLVTDERFLYLPMAGLGALVGLGVMMWLWHGAADSSRSAIALLRNNKSVICVISVVILAWGLRTVARNKDWKDELTLFSKTVEAVPTSVVGLQNLGNAYADRGRTEEAITTYKRALQIAPKYARPRVNLANLLLIMTRLDEAEQEARQAVELAPELPFAHVVLGAVLLKQNKPAEAEEQALKALQADPDDPSAVTILGLAHMGMGRYAESVEAFKKAVLLHPSDYHIRYNLACAYSLAGDVGSALSALQEAIRLGNKSTVRNEIESDPDLALVRGDPRFGEIMKGIP